MGKVMLDEIYLTNIANAIRTKKGTSNKMYPQNMASEITSIQTGGGTTSGGKRMEVGDTTMQSINTGLSKIDFLVIFKRRIETTGLITLIYEGVSSVNVVYCTNYNTYMQACEQGLSSNFTISNGRFDWNGNYNDKMGFQTSGTYTWIAIGT